MGTFYIKEDDTSPIIQATLKNPDGTAVNLTDSTVTIRVAGARGGKNIIDSTATIDDATNGVVSYNFSSGETSDNGRYRLEFEVNFGVDGTETFPNKGYHTLMIGRNMEV